MLAPEEIFAPNPSDLRAKSEMTSTEKRARRNKERKSWKKTRDILKNSVDKFAKMKGVRGAKKRKEEAVKTLLKHGRGVTVLGKKGRLSRTNHDHSRTSS
jgi:U3 small nucleolar RNA-associated protein MPP10